MWVFDQPKSTRLNVQDSRERLDIMSDNTLKPPSSPALDHYKMQSSSFHEKVAIAFPNSWALNAPKQWIVSSSRSTEVAILATFAIGTAGKTAIRTFHESEDEVCPQVRRGRTLQSPDEVLSRTIDKRSVELLCKWVLWQFKRVQVTSEFVVPGIFYNCLEAITFDTPIVLKLQSVHIIRISWMLMWVPAMCVCDIGELSVCLLHRLFARNPLSRTYFPQMRISEHNARSPVSKSDFFTCLIYFRTRILQWRFGVDSGS